MSRYSVLALDLVLYCSLPHSRLHMMMHMQANEHTDDATHISAYIQHTFKSWYKEKDF